ncbi:MAG: oligosaccharide flippase family protein [Baekduiaceae bacterium]
MTGAAPDGADILDTPEAGRRLVLGGAVRVTGFVAGTGLAVLGAALVTRYLGPEEYGQFQTVLALVTIVQAITDLGMTALGMREYSQRHGEDRDRFLAALLGLRLVATAFGLAIAVGVAVLLGYDETMVLGAALMGVGLVFGILQGTLGIPLAAGLRIGTMTTLDLARQAALAATYAALVVAGSGVLAFYAATIPAQFAIFLITALLVRGVISLRPSFDVRAWIALIRPAVVFALAVAVGQLYVYTALILTELVTTPFETGLFAASFRVYIIVAAVPGVLVTTAFPLLSRAARGDPVRLAYATQRLFEGTALLGGAALIGCVLGAEAIIAVVAGSEYDGAIEVLQIQGVALALTFVIATWGFTLLAVHHHRSMIVANAVAMVVSTTTVLVLAAEYGAVGAAVATVLGELALAIGYVAALVQVDRQMRPEFDLVLRAMPALALGLAVGAVVPLPAVIATVVGLAVYAAALLLFRAVPDEVLEHVPGPLGARARE